MTLSQHGLNFETWKLTKNSINQTLGKINIRLDKDVLKTSSWHLLSLSSEDVFRTSSRRLYQDEYICFSHKSSEDILIKTNIFVLFIHLQDVFKMSCKNVFKTSSRRLAKMSSRHLTKTSSSRHIQDVLKTYHQVKLFLLRHLQDVFERCLGSF